MVIRTTKTQPRHKTEEQMKDDVGCLNQRHRKRHLIFLQRLAPAEPLSATTRSIIGDHRHPNPILLSTPRYSYIITQPPTTLARNNI